MRHADVLLGQQGDLVFIQPDAVGQQHPFRLQQAEPLQCADRAAAEALHRLTDFRFRLVGVGVQTGVVALAHGDCAATGFRRGVVHMFQPNPDVDAAIGLAVPLLDQRFVVIQGVEVVVAFGLAHVGHHHHAVAERFGGAGGAGHVAPHVDRGGGAG